MHTEIELQKRIKKLLAFKYKSKTDNNETLDYYYFINYEYLAHVSQCLTDIKDNQLLALSKKWINYKDQLEDRIVECELHLDDHLIKYHSGMPVKEITNIKCNLVKPATSIFDKVLIETVKNNPDITIGSWWQNLRKYKNVTYAALDIEATSCPEKISKIRKRLFCSKFDVIDFDESSPKINQEKAVLIFVNNQGDQTGKQFKISYDYVRKKINEIQNNPAKFFTEKRI